MQFDEASGRLILPNLYNTRDLGGMTYGNGPKTALHRLIRSDALNHITSQEPDDLAPKPKRKLTRTSSKTIRALRTTTSLFSSSTQTTWTTHLSAM